MEEINSNGSDLNEISVLVADDDSTVRNIIGFSLISNNIYKVDFVENGKEALEYYNKKNYDLVLLDIQMPIMRGDECLEEIRVINPEQKVIAVSSYVSEIGKGFDGIVPKPFTPTGLYSSIERVFI